MVHQKGLPADLLKDATITVHSSQNVNYNSQCLTLNHNNHETKIHFQHSLSMLCKVKASVKRAIVIASVVFSDVKVQFNHHCARLSFLY